MFHHLENVSSDVTWVRAAPTKGRKLPLNSQSVDIHLVTNICSRYVLSVDLDHIMTRLQQDPESLLWEIIKQSWFNFHHCQHPHPPLEGRQTCFERRHSESTHQESCVPIISHMQLTTGFGSSYFFIAGGSGVFFLSSFSTLLLSLDLS